MPLLCCSPAHLNTTTWLGTYTSPPPVPGHYLYSEQHTLTSPSDINWLKDRLGASLQFVRLSLSLASCFWKHYSGSSSLIFPYLYSLYASRSLLLPEVAL